MVKGYSRDQYYLEDQDSSIATINPVIKDGLIYTIDSENNLMCIEAKTGQTVYSVKLKGNITLLPFIRMAGYIFVQYVVKP